MHLNSCEARRLNITSFFLIGVVFYVVAAAA